MIVQITPYDKSNVLLSFPSFEDLIIQFKSWGITLSGFLILPFLLSKKERSNPGVQKILAIIGLSILGITLFYLSYAPINKYVGYSRFQLIITALLLGSFLLKKNNYSQFPIFVIVIAIVLNLSMTPIDGWKSKENFWGDFKYKTSEIYFPYNDIYADLSRVTGISDKSIAVIGRTYYYFDSFYFFKHEFRPEIFEESIYNTPNEIADISWSDYVIWQVDPLAENNPAYLDDIQLKLSLFERWKSYSNGENTLILYKKK